MDIVIKKTILIFLFSSPLIYPLSAVSNPANILNKVVFPPPEGAMTERTEPSFIRAEKSFMTSFSPNFLDKNCDISDT